MTHRSHHVNTVLSEIHEGDDVRAGSEDTRCVVRVLLSCSGRRRSFQHKRREVEEQGSEVVHHILE